MEPFDLFTSPLCGTNLIEASAGTGKTYTLAALYLRFILEQGLTPEQILVVTFTEAATKELRDRIRRRLRDAVEAFGGAPAADASLARLRDEATDLEAASRRLTPALRSFDQASIFTIHGFCQRILHENAFESSSLFDTELVTRQDDLKREIIEDFWRTRFYNAPPHVVRYALTRGYGPAVFFELVGTRVFCQPDLNILPQIQAPSMVGLQEEVEDLVDAVQTLEKVWPDSKEAVRLQLRSPSLGGNSIYRALTAKGQAEGESLRDTKIEELFGDMELFLRGKDPAFPLPLGEQFEAFTASRLKKATRKNCTVPTHDVFQLCERIYTRAANIEKTMEEYFLWLKREAWDYVSAELPVRKQRLNVQHFDDLLLRLKEGLEQPGGAQLASAVQARYHAALIDEFQDTDPVQYAIFRTLFNGPHRSLFLIGDPKQAIYSFRGADIFTYMKAAGAVDRAFSLETNWRSEPDLIQAVNTVFTTSHPPFVYPEIGFQPVSAPPARAAQPLVEGGLPRAPLQLWFLGSERLGAGSKPINKGEAQAMIRDAVGAEMVRLLKLAASGHARVGDRPLRESDLAVLVRTNPEARELKDTLTGLNIPCVLYSTEDVLDTAEAEDMERVLRAVAEPHREGLLRAALATDLLGASGQNLARWMTDEARWEEWIVQFRTYGDLWNKHGFMRMFRSFMMEQRVRSRLLALNHGERRITNVLHLAEILHQESVEGKLGALELLEWFTEVRNPDFRGTQEHQLRLESDENAVKLVTIHKSKGLEYPVVFCPFSWGSSKLKKPESPYAFHDERNERALTLDLGSDDRETTRMFAEKELLAENTRLLYVALTRAQKRCYLVWGRFNTAETSSLAYLLHGTESRGAENVLKKMTDTWKGLDDASMWGHLQSLADRAGGTIDLQSLDMEQPEAYAPVELEREALHPRLFEGSIQRHWRISSFSALTSNLAHGAEVPDRDETDQPDLEAMPAVEVSAMAGEALDIFAFPRGARPGTFLHDILEHLDFTAAQGPGLEDMVRQKLHDYGFDPKWLQAVRDMILKVLSVSLGQGSESFTLSRVPVSDRLNELEFTFPLEALTPGKLQRVFAQGGHETAAPGSREWADQLGRLNFQPVKGFIKGFMDLVFRFGERYYLVDWKSNHLGDRVADYHPKALSAAMQREYYVLQYHLYTVALDRYLTLRLPGYRYEDHFGGAFYVFLRGVDPQAGTHYGIYHHRPEHDLIQELSRVLAGRGGIQA